MSRGRGAAVALAENSAHSKMKFFTRAPN